MLKTENYIAFMTVCGFFVGLIFSTFSEIKADYFLFTTLGITLFFYSLTLITASYILKNDNVKTTYVLHKDIIEERLDQYITELEKRERVIQDIHDFVKTIEREEYEDKPLKEKKYVK